MRMLISMRKTTQATQRSQINFLAAAWLIVDTPASRALAVSQPDHQNHGCRSSIRLPLTKCAIENYHGWCTQMKI